MVEKNFNIKQTAKILGIQVRTVREWIKKGKISAKKYNSCPMWFISEKEIDRIQKDMK